jgi:hypothetical protein
LKDQTPFYFLFHACAAMQKLERSDAILFLISPVLPCGNLKDLTPFYSYFRPALPVERTEGVAWLSSYKGSKDLFKFEKFYKIYFFIRTLNFCGIIKVLA